MRGEERRGRGESQDGDVTRDPSSQAHADRIAAQGRPGAHTSGPHREDFHGPETVGHAAGDAERCRTGRGRQPGGANPLAVAMAPSADGLSCLVSATGLLGTCQVVVSASLGGAAPSQATLDIEVDADVASQLALGAGTPGPLASPVSAGTGGPSSGAAPGTSPGGPSASAPS